MKKILLLTLIFTLLSPLYVPAQTKQNISLLFYNGKVFTADEKFSMAEAVAVDGEKIVAVGSSDELKAEIQSRAGN